MKSVYESVGVDQLITYVIIHAPHNVTVYIQLRQEGDLWLVIRVQSNILYAGFGRGDPKILHIGSERIVTVVDVGFDKVLRDLDIAVCKKPPTVFTYLDETVDTCLPSTIKSDEFSCLSV